MKENNYYLHGSLGSTDCCHQFNSIKTPLSIIVTALLVFSSLLFNSNINAQVCVPVYTTGVSDGDLISQVVISGTTLSNNSGTSLSGPSYTFYGPPTYTDENYTAELQAGASYTMTVTVGTFGGQNVAVWIDFNDDNVFSESERIGYTTATINGNSSGTFTINLPCDAELGPHIMRIRDVWNTTGINIDPCASYGYGETEDYIVTVTAAPSCPLPSEGTAENILAHSATLVWNNNCGENLVNLHLQAAGGGEPTDEPSHPGVSTPLTVTGLTNATEYEFWVSAICDGEPGEWTGPYTFSTLLANPQPAANWPLIITQGTFNSIAETGTPYTALAADNAQVNITGLSPGIMIDNVVYTNARMSSNGWLMLYSGTAPTSTTESGILSTAVPNAGVVFAPLNVDLHTSFYGGTGGYYEYVGDEHVFEWKNFSRYNGTLSNRLDQFNFQVRLNTATGAVSFVYGDVIPGAGLTTLPRVGWKTNGAVANNWATDINNLTLNITGSPTSCTWEDAVTGFSNLSDMHLLSTNTGVGPSNGLTYTWIPQDVPAPVRTFGAVTDIEAYSATIHWSPSAGATGYNVRYRALGSCEWTHWSGNPTTSTSAQLTGLTSGTTYQVQVQALSGDNASIWSHIPTQAGGLGTNGYNATGTFTTLLTCLPPNNLTANANSQTSASFSWTAPTEDSENFEYVITEVDGNPTGAGTPTTETTITVDDLLPSTTYYIYVRTVCDNGDYSPWTSTTVYTGYCIPTATSTADYISLFTTSDALVNVTFSSTGGSPYTDNTAMVITEHAGGSFTFSTTYVGGGNGVKVWIDWNNNLVFDDDEVMFYQANGNATKSGVLNIPIDAALGNYRMRVRAQYGSTANPPACGSIGWGEAEDYTLNVVEAPECLPVTSLTATLTGSSATLNWVDLTENNLGYEVVISTVNVTPTVEGVFTNETTFTVNDLEVGTYYAFVKTICSEDLESLWTVTSFYVGYCQVTSTNTTYGISNFTTTNGITNIANPSGPSSYSDFTNLSVSMYESGTVNFSITSVTSTVGFGVWVDWNNDYDFDDPGEHVYNSGTYLDNTSGSITVPAGTPVGNYRMRVVANWLSSSPTPCGFLGSTSSTYGEAEDYTFTVIIPPSCFPPVNLVALTSGTSVDLTWSHPGENAEEYEVVISTENTLPTTAGEIVSTTSYTANDLPVNTTYYAFVRAICDDEVMSLWTSTSFYIGYCEVTSISTNYGISNFTTTNGITNISHSSGPGSYSDYTDQVVSMYPSGSVNFTVASAGTSTTIGVGIWIDWNNDLDFDDPGEHVFNSGSYVSTATGTITVPIGVPVGNYRMRVVGNWLSTNPTPCGNLGSTSNTYGEAEDYTFAVVETPGCLPPAFLSVNVTSLTTATFSWMSANENPAGFEYVITGTIGTPTEEGTFTTEMSVDLDNLSFGTVYGYVRTDCGEDGYSEWAGPIAITIFEGDEPCTAIELPVLGACQFQTFDNTGATTSDPSNIQAPGCANYGGNDMWFTFVVPANGVINIDAIQGTITDAGAAVYMSSDDCNGYLSLIECDDDDSDNGFMPAISLTNLTPGTVLYLRVWKYGGNQSGTFGICVSSPCTAPGMPSLTPVGNTITATWPSAGEGLSYNWELREYGDPGSGSDGLVTSGVTEADQLSVLIEGLNYASPYTFYVSTNCGDVTSLWSNPVSTTTEVLQGCTDPAACNYNIDAMIDDGSCIFETTTLYRDADGDGYGDPDEEYESCGATLEGYVANNTDCDDSDPEVWQTGTFYIDNDGDGYDAGQQEVCYGATIPNGYAETTNGHDCDDNDSESFGPTAIEVTIEMPITTVCDNSAAFTLTGGSPAGGTWSGTGVTNGTFNPNGLAPGFYQITYTVAGDGVCTTTGSQTAEIEIENCTINVDELDAYNIRLYPTFTNNHVTVVGFDLKEAVIMDAHGKRLNTVSLINNNIVDMSSYAAGIYFIHVTSNTTTQIFKVVRVH